MAVVSAATAAWVVARAERRAQAQLSAAESDALEQFYALLAPRRVDKVTAVWFIRSHSNARLAAASCVRMCEWREQKQRADDLAGRPLDIPASVKSALDAAFSPVALDGVDALGRPIMYTPCGNVNLPALAKEGVTLELLVRRYVVAAEKVRWALLKSDDPLQGHLQILDLYGIDVAAFLGSMPFYSAIISVGERYFPSLLGCMCVVRCPEAAEWLVATIRKVRVRLLLRKLMDEKAASSIQLVKGDPQLGLRELVPNELLPANLRVPVALEEDMKPLQRVGLETRMLAEKLIKAGQRSMSKTGDALSSVGISMFGADHKSAKESSNEPRAWIDVDDVPGSRADHFASAQCCEQQLNKGAQTWRVFYYHNLDPCACTFSSSNRSRFIYEHARTYLEFEHAQPMDRNLGTM